MSNNNSIRKEPKYIRFELIIPTIEGQKTKRYNVVTKFDREMIGLIKWFGRWRCYAFFPIDQTVFERVCLRDIAAFLDKLMEERKSNK